jgi:hypothetical protein
MRFKFTLYIVNDPDVPFNVFIGFGVTTIVMASLADKAASDNHCHDCGIASSLMTAAISRNWHVQAGRQCGSVRAVY